MNSIFNNPSACHFYLLIQRRSGKTARHIEPLGTGIHVPFRDLRVYLIFHWPNQSSLTLEAERVSGLQNIWITARLEQLLAVSHPLWVVDAIDIVLHFHHDTAILGDRTRKIGRAMKPLGLLQRNGTTLLSAAVKLKGVLVGVNVKLDSRPG